MTTMRVSPSVSVSGLSRSRQHGGAALGLVLLLGVLGLMMGALAIRGSVSELRVAGAQRHAKAGFSCAEAGLSASRAYFAAQYPSWNSLFSGASVSGYPVSGDLDGDGVTDYSVTLVDNTDEFGGTPPNANQDNDLTAIMVSRCVSRRMGARELREIITVPPRGSDYRYQAGSGSANAGNKN